MCTSVGIVLWVCVSINACWSGGFSRSLTRTGNEPRNVVCASFLVLFLFFSFLFVSFFRLVHCRSWLVYQDWFMPVHLVGGHRQNVVGRIVDAVYDWYDLCREYSGWDWSWVGLESLNAQRIIFSSEFAMVWGCLVL